MADDEKAALHRYLQAGRDALFWKLDNLSAYDRRRPLVSSGTNLLGLVKHVARMESGYFGEVFGRPFPEPLPWMTRGEINADMWATPEETTKEICDLSTRVSRHADVTIETLPLDAIGVVPWWSGDRRTVTLHRILVHMVAEIHRHVGHADIVRELIDGSIGMRPDALVLPSEGDAWWSAYREKVEGAARSASDS